ncbi:leucine rich repeat [Seminavis robusta]|uniref:Leucine rich repeat n=1 Tax=Seminavis robusta TaxID=568900 RepID=A0A9N8ELE7_9STRA|nr:leucine rich repeat [Seminavis robusta]|eukprot:Sro1307_g261380.1 leucine rich repeat (601) ;mRNA; r:24731-26702
MDDEVNVDYGIRTSVIPPLPPLNNYEESDRESGMQIHYSAGSIDPTNGALPARLVNADGDALEGYTHAPPEVLDATDIAVVPSENEERAQFSLRRKRVLMGGAALCFLVALTVIIPVVVIVPGDDTVVQTTVEPSQSPSSVPTLSPTVEPISDALAEMLQTLQQYTKNNANDPWWTRRSSPQFRAAKWLADVDTLPITSQSQLLQRFALVTFYYSTTNVSGNGNADDWREDWHQCGVFSSGCNGEHWLSVNVHECDWLYVNCETITIGDQRGRLLQGNDVDDTMRVVVQVILPLHGNNLRGTLPPQLSLLTYLEVFAASNNKITGGVNSGDGNNNNTDVPPLHDVDQAFMEVTTLRVLNLVGNNISGSLPVNIWQHSPDMELLLLSENEFIGEIPHELSAMANLLELQLQSNQLHGSIPHSIGNLTTLRLLSLASNQLSGTLSAEFFDLPALTSLDLSNNTGLSGTLAGELSNINVFSASFTQLNGPLPDTLFEDLTQLEKLDVESAALTGTLSEQLALWNDSIQILRLQNNQFTGIIPNALDALTRLGELRLEGNSFSGTISDAVCARRGQGFQQLGTLTVDCSVECSCCDDYEKCSNS